MIKQEIIVKKAKNIKFEFQLYQSQKTLIHGIKP